MYKYFLRIVLISFVLSQIFFCLCLNILFILDSYEYYYYYNYLKFFYLFMFIFFKLFFVAICECEKNELKVGDRVIWMYDNEPISGIVRWIGFSESNQLKVNIQFVSILYLESICMFY